MSDFTCQPSELTPLERAYILQTQNGLPLVPQPYQVIAAALGVSVQTVLTMTQDLSDRGIIRRIAAVPNHYKLGYRHNGMTVWDVQDEFVSSFGDAIGRLPFVSHCYLRPRHLPSWNYNLFAMVHGKSRAEIDGYRMQICQLLEEVLVTNRFYKEQPLPSNDMLISSQILKKTGLRLNSDKANSASVLQPTETTISKGEANV